MANKFTNLTGDLKLKPDIVSHANLKGGGLRRHGITIPNYVATENQAETPVPLLSSTHGGTGMPAFFRFALPSGWVDKPGVGGLKKLKDYYGDAKYSHEFMKKLSAPRRTEKSFINFYLQKVNENFQEKYQLVETFGDSFVAFFFGKRIMILTIIGVVIDDQLSDGKTQLIKIYDAYLRGHHTAKHKILTEFGYGTTTVQGVLLSLNTETGDVQNEVHTTFSAQMLVYKYAKAGSNLAQIYDANLVEPYDVGAGDSGISSVARSFGTTKLMARADGTQQSAINISGVPPVAVFQTSEGLVAEVKDKKGAVTHLLQPAEKLAKIRDCAKTGAVNVMEALA